MFFVNSEKIFTKREKGIIIYQFICFGNSIKSTN